MIKQQSHQRKNKKWNEYTRVTIVDRIKIIYDHKVHGLQLDTLTQKYRIQSNTIRHILATYKSYGLVDANKFKRQVANNSHSNKDGSDQNEDIQEMAILRQSKRPQPSTNKQKDEEFESQIIEK